MSEPIDALRLNISTDIDTKSIATLTTALKGLQAASGGNNVSGLAGQMTELSKACKDLQTASISLTSLINSLNSLDNVKGTGINNAAKGLKDIPNALNGIKSLNLGETSQEITGLTTALQPLNSIDGSGIKNVASGLGKLPQALTGLQGVNVSDYTEKIQQLVTALTPLSSVMRNIADGGNVLNSTFKVATKTTKEYGTANQTASLQVGSLGSSVTTFTHKLSSLIVKIAAAVGGFRAISKAIQDGIVNSMDYIENLNLFTVSMGEYADSQQRYAETVSDIMGIDPSEWMRNEGVFNNMLEGFGIGTDDAAWMSQNLTGLLYDYASFYNLTIEQAAQKITSAISGELEPVRRQGFDLSQAALTQLAQDPQWYGDTAYSINEVTGAIQAYTEALDTNGDAVIANYSDMTQAEKAQLRYIALLTQNSDMVGDFARTLEDPANQLRIFKNNMTMVSRALGNIFIPALNKVMPYLIAGAQVLKDILNTIAELMGFQLPDMSSRVSLGSDATAGYEDIEDSVSGAASNAKKLKDYMIGIDELNVLNTDDNSSGGGSGSAGYASDLSYALPGYDFIGDATNSKVAQIKAQIEDLLNSTENEFRTWGEKVGAVLNGVLEKWENPWETGFELGDATAKAASFFDGVVVEFDWELAGKDVGEMVSGFFSSDATYEIPNLILDVGRGVLSFASAVINHVNVFEVADEVKTGIVEAIMKDYSDINFGGHFEKGVWVIDATGQINWTLDSHISWAERHPFSSWFGDQLLNIFGMDYVDREGNFVYDMPVIARITMRQVDNPFATQLLSYFTGENVTREQLIHMSLDLDSSVKNWIKENLVDKILEALATIAEGLGEFLHIDALEDLSSDIEALIDNAPNSGGGGSYSSFYNQFRKPSGSNSSRSNTDMGNYYSSYYSQQSRSRNVKGATEAGRDMANAYVKGLKSGEGLISNAGYRSGEIYAEGIGSNTSLVSGTGDNLKNTLVKALSNGLYNTLLIKGSEGGKGFNNGAYSWRGKIGETGTNLKNTLVSNVSGNLYGLLYNAGSNGVSGFSEAFKSSPHIKSLINNAKAMAQSAIDTVKATLDVHSPSVVMKEIGTQTVEGLANGFKDTSAINTAIKQTYEKATPTVTDQVKQTVTKATNTAVNTTKNTLTKGLKIKSPSRVFMEIGAYTAEGFNVGFSEEAKNTYSMMNTYARKLSNVSVNGLYTPSNNAVAPTLNPNISAQVQANNTAAMATMAMTMYEAITGAMTANQSMEKDIKLSVQINGKEIFNAVRDEQRKRGIEVSNGAFGG